MRVVSYSSEPASMLLAWATIRSVTQPIGELAAPRHHRRHDPLVPRRPVRLEPVAVVVPGQLAQEREPLFGEAGESHQRGQLRSWLK